MENVVAILIGTAWAAIFGMLVWGSVSAWRRQLRSDESARREVLR